ncbi:hypothetical protein [Saccharicrinis sp. 156]|uniref:hypothetical protein n=1 Tax=Saccharicrinis sp. 156 TaxID=3417574 RepID=UPI003D330034
MQRTISIILIISLFFTGKLLAQNNIEVDIESKVLISSKDNLLPLYQYSNQWGIVSPFEQTQALVLAGAKYNLLQKSNIRLQLGVSGVVKNKAGDSFLHEAYLKGQFINVIDFSIGKQAYTSISIDDNLTSGGFMMNSNARPVPRAMIGIFDYWPVSFLGDVIEVKGGISHGVLNDDRTTTGRGNSADDLLVHEKWAYIRGGKLKVKPYVGLFHGALYGGTRPNGTEITTDFWATFWARGSEKIGGGEATNVAGAHDGFWDLGINYETEMGYFQFYVHKPFADGTGLKITKERNRDYKIGIYARLKKTRLIQRVSVELLKTDYQSGSGIPDPVYPGTYSIIFVDDIEDYDAFMRDTFGEVTEGYTSWHLMRYLEKVQNHGQKYGSRDDYNNNGSYYNGWTYHQMPMGTPLYHTYWQAQAYAPDWKPNNKVVFMNNRIKGFHFGIEGVITDGLSYIFKSTYTLNKGAYGEQYVDRYSWEEEPDFFYEGGKKQVYSYLGLTYKNRNWRNITLQGSVSIDSGELYDAFGCMLGIKYSPELNF